MIVLELTLEMIKKVIILHSRIWHRNTLRWLRRLLSTRTIKANDRKAMEYDRRFGTQYYKRTSIEKSKPFSLEEWSRKAKEDIIKHNPDGTLRIDTGLGLKSIW